MQPAGVLLEALEPRIAPATFNIGDPAAGLGFNVSGYSDTAVFKFAYDAPSQGPQIFKQTDPGASEHFFMALGPRDVVNLFPSTTARVDSYIKMDSGLAYAFFHDKDGNNKVTANELTGLAVSGGSQLSLKGSVDGDIVANVVASTKRIHTDNLVSTNQTILGLNVSGDVGLVAAGGNISKVNVGSVSALQSGNNNTALDFSFGGSGKSPLSSAGDGTLAAFKPTNGTAGGNLTDISVRSSGLIMAGLGGDGGKGGDIRNLSVVADPNGMSVLAGAGGDRLSGTGGAGGSIFQVLYRGAAESDSSKAIKIYGGDGGNGLTGGKGGDVGQVWVGYDRARAGNSLAIESPNILLNPVVISGGQGGDGTSAGAGGNLNVIRVVAAPPAGVGVISGFEIAVQGGDAGALTARGAAGAGGTVNDFAVKNYHQGASEVLVAGGQASNVPLGLEVSRGANGGSLSNPVPRVGVDGWFLGRDFEFRGGSGALGGQGGAVTNIYFERQVDDALRLVELRVQGGNGGGAAAANGGSGGAVQGVFIPNSFLTGVGGLNIVGGAGGASTSGIGGAGGAVSRIDILAAEGAAGPALLTALFRGGDGANGRTGGGVGGNLSDIKFFPHFSSVEARGGHGGSASLGTVVAGSGGNGGNVSGFSLAQQARVSPAQQTVVVSGGDGGNARLTGNAGTGGSVGLVGILNQGDITVRGGQGGDAGQAGATGIGGSLGGSNARASALSLTSVAGSVIVEAGAGGDRLTPSEAPARGGAGGSITNLNALAQSGLTIQAGNGGAAGGQGGSLARIGFSGSGGPGTLVAGSVLIKAGDGAQPLTAQQAGGNGGNLSFISGYGSSVVAGVMRFEAGDGGSAQAAGARGGNGGNVSDLRVFDTRATAVVLAGDGGNGFASAGTGGSVSNVAFNSLTGRHLWAVAAGDGGDVLAGRNVGAAGGSINKVDASHDIGVRHGVAFGFGTMGGIFAGASGVNTALGQTDPNTATNGRVTNITAAAISSIVAGKDPSPWLVNTVDRVYLRGNAALLASGSEYRLPDPLRPGTLLGGSAALDAANFVGAKFDPSSTSFAVDGGTPRPPSGTSSSAWSIGVTKPSDGLIAALSFTANRNFMPLALVTNVAAPRAPLQIGLLVPNLPTPR
jgi:hypothetical protein